MPSLESVVDAIPTQCHSVQDRAAREAATQELFQRRSGCTYDAEGRRCLELIVELNIEIARGIARRYRNKGPDPEDLDQVAYLGLVKAARAYRLDANTPFIGYAIPTIHGELKRYFRDVAWTIRIPRKLQEIQGMLMTKVPQFEQELGRQLRPDEMAARLGLELQDVEDALAARGCFDVLSMDYPVADGNLALADVVADDDGRDVDRLERIDMLQPVLEDLSARDRRILELRFVEGWTQGDIGAEIGVSQMQVSRLLRQILGTLRTRLAPLSDAA